MIGCICYLKSLDLTREIFHESFTFYNLFVFWSDNEMDNLIWLLPILLNLYIIGKFYYENMSTFEMRFKNRKCYIYHQLRCCIVDSILLNLVILFVQYIVLGLHLNIFVSSDFILLEIIAKYVIELTALNMVLILLAMILNDFTYSFIILTIFQILALKLVGVSKDIPFLSLYKGSEMNYFTILLLFFTMIGVIFIYKRMELK